MKLDHKRTVLVGLAFLSICAFWQMYDNIIPLILTNTVPLRRDHFRRDHGGGQCAGAVFAAVLRRAE